MLGNKKTWSYTVTQTTHNPFRPRSFFQSLISPYSTQVGLEILENHQSIKNKIWVIISPSVCLQNPDSDTWNRGSYWMTWQKKHYKDINYTEEKINQENSVSLLAVFFIFFYVDFPENYSCCSRILLSSWILHILVDFLCFMNINSLSFYHTDLPH